MNIGDLRKMIYYNKGNGRIIWIGAKNNSHNGRQAGWVDKHNGRRYIQIRRKNYRAEKIAWLYVYGELPKCEILFKNKDRNDLRIDNLKRADGVTPRIYMTQYHLKRVLDYNKKTGVFKWKFNYGNAKMGDRAGYVNRGVRMIKINGLHYMASRLAWLYTFGEYPIYRLMHLNENKLDDRTSNLYQDVPGKGKPDYLHETKVDGLFYNKYTNKFQIHGHREFKTKEAAIRVLMVEKATASYVKERKPSHGWGRIGTYPWHENAVNILENTHGIIRYVREVTGKQLENVYSLPKLKKIALWTIKSHMEKHDVSKSRRDGKRCA